MVKQPTFHVIFSVCESIASTLMSLGGPPGAAMQEKKGVVSSYCILLQHLWPCNKLQRSYLCSMSNKLAINYS